MSRRLVFIPLGNVPGPYTVRLDGSPRLRSVAWTGGIAGIYVELDTDATDTTHTFWLVVENQTLPDVPLLYLGLIAQTGMHVYYDITVPEEEL